MELLTQQQHMPSERGKGRIPKYFIYLHCAQKKSGSLHFFHPICLQTAPCWHRIPKQAHQEICMECKLKLLPVVWVFFAAPNCRKFCPPPPPPSKWQKIRPRSCRPVGMLGKNWEAILGIQGKICYRRKSSSWHTISSAESLLPVSHCDIELSPCVYWRGGLAY